MKRIFPDYPVVGVGAVIINDNNILLIKRGKEPGRGTWTIPGGVVEAGESLKDALKREINEECGIDIEITDSSAVLEKIFKDGEAVKYHYVLIDYLAYYSKGNPVASSDADEVKWYPLFPLELLPVEPLTKEVIQKLISSTLKR